ncbi:hypothetical protein [uncultured Desulfosarcina sp.]|uniref:hypothetical protein n=1 Tax=uncultured Desulfosarcina sp. TaxID=218289 RepID=UPI0029C89176|nr:hypothetical protein [uncultured Desulfosarcina sp.]
MLNPFRRSFMLPGKLGACLVTGTEKIRCGYGNGDCLLLDLRHGIFAVADTSERFPQASRLLLEGLAATVCQKGPPEDENEFNSLLSQVWSNQQFIHKTTLSCVVLLENGAGPTAMVSNNGDSSVTILASDSGAVRYRTVADMNFAGRSTRPNPAVTHSLKGTPTAIVLATDGITDLGKIPLNGLSDPPHRIGDRIAGRLHRGKARREIDDIGAVALTPDIMNDATGDIIIMGGTLPGVETTFAQRNGWRTAADRWATTMAWKPYPELLAMAGIQIRQPGRC